MKRVSVRELLGTICLWLLAGTADADTVLYLNSRTHDYVGQGRHRTLTNGDFDFRVQRDGQGLSFDINNAAHVPPGAARYWSVGVAPRAGFPLVPGTYDNATQYPFSAPGTPGLAVGGEGRGCSRLEGRFVVFEIAIDPSTGGVSRFAADFEQHCEQRAAPALFGAIRFNSSVPLPLQDEALVDFGPSAGVWGYSDDRGFVPIHPFSPLHMVTGDLDGNGEVDQIFDFPGHGIWVRRNRRTWQQLHHLNASAVVTGDLDASGRDEVIVAFPGYGIWSWKNDTAWTQLHPLDPAHMATAFLDPLHRADLVVDFPGYGTWVWWDDSNWFSLHPSNPLALGAGGINPFLQDGVVTSSAAAGIWAWDYVNQWFAIHPLPARHMLTADVDGQLGGDLVAAFEGNGIWVRFTGISSPTWQLLLARDTEGIAAADVDADGHADLLVDLGTLGLWLWKNNSAWIPLHGLNPHALASGRLDGR